MNPKLVKQRWLSSYVQVHTPLHYNLALLNIYMSDKKIMVNL